MAAHATFMKKKKLSRLLSRCSLRDARIQQDALRQVSLSRAFGVYSEQSMRGVRFDPLQKKNKLK